MKRNICFFMTLMVIMGNLLIPQMVSANGSYSGTVYVCTEDGHLNMRTEPIADNDQNIVEQIPDCFAIDIKYVNDNGKWGYGDCFIENGYYASGWVYLPMTRPTYEEARDHAGRVYQKTLEVASPDGELNMRREAGARKYNIICAIPNGTVVTVTRKTDKGWGLISYNGQQGWICLEGYTKEYVAPTPAATSAPVQVPTQMTEGQPKQGMNFEMDHGRMIRGNILVLLLICVAVFLIVAVVILLVVVSKRGKETPMPYYPQDFNGYSNQGDAFYGAEDDTEPDGAYYDTDDYVDANSVSYDTNYDEETEQDYGIAEPNTEETYVE